MRSPESFTSEDEDEDTDVDMEKASESSHMTGHGEKKAAEIIHNGQKPHIKFREFVAMVKAEVPPEAKYGYIQLAMLYAFINNMVRTSFACSSKVRG